LTTTIDVTRVVEMMNELEGAEGVDPGAKFEAFAYVDRVLAVDLSRDLGRRTHRTRPLSRDRAPASAADGTGRG
jgi:hypothetical protein